MKTYEVITHEILTKTFRLKANSEEEAWEAHLYSCTDCLVDESTSHVLASVCLSFAIRFLLIAHYI